MNDRTKGASTFLRAFWPHLLGLAGGIGIGLPNLADANGALVLGPIHTDKIAAFWIGSGLLFVSIAALAVRERDQREVGSKVIELQTDRARLVEGRRRLLRQQLIPLGRKLGFYSSERLSLYLRQGPHLLLVGRFSANPAFEERSSDDLPWPIDQGVLGFAWRERQWSPGELTDPLSSYENWVAEQVSRCAISEQVARSLRMKARTYAAIRIENRYGTDPLGVLIAESTRVRSAIPPGSYNPPDLDPDGIFRRVRTEHMRDLYDCLRAIS